MDEIKSSALYELRAFLYLTHPFEHRVPVLQKALTAYTPCTRIPRRNRYDKRGVFSVECMDVDSKLRESIFTGGINTFFPIYPYGCVFVNARHCKN